MTTQTSDTAEPTPSPRPDSGDAAPRSLTGWRAGDRQFLRRLLAVFLVVFGIEWIWVASQNPRPVEIRRGDAFARLFTVDINTATWIDWMQLEGIGPTLAHRIEADRRLNGPFRSIDDVGRVPGIGPVKLNQIRPWLVHNPDPAPTKTDPE